MNTILMILVLGLLMISLIAPFSALAMLMLSVFVSAALWAVWSLVKAFVRGEPS